MAQSPISFHWNKKKSVIIKDKGFGKEFYRDVGNIFRQEMNDFVPYLTGALANNVAIAPSDTSVAITYRVPYARRQYYGEGVVNRTTDPHSLATSFWDVAAWETRKSVIGKRVNEARIKHAK